MDPGISIYLSMHVFLFVMYMQMCVNHQGYNTYNLRSHKCLILKFSLNRETISSSNKRDIGLFFLSHFLKLRTNEL